MRGWTLTVAGILVVASLMASAPRAEASRDATADEVEGVIEDLQLDYSCDPLVVVSTVDTTWAVASDAADTCAESIVDGPPLLLHLDGGWHAVATVAARRATCDQRDPISSEVAVDLDLCSLPSAHIYVRLPEPRLRPRSFQIGMSSGLDKLHWRQWDTRRAVARGHLEVAAILVRHRLVGYSGPAHVELSQPVSCFDSVRIYSRLLVRQLAAPHRTIRERDRTPCVDDGGPGVHWPGPPPAAPQDDTNMPPEVPLNEPAYCPECDGPLRAVAQDS